MDRTQTLFSRLATPALLAGLMLPVSAASLEAQATLIRNVRVFDGVDATGPTGVLIRDGRIAAVGADQAAPAGAEVVDGSGMTLLPGLIDAHTHAFGNALQEALVFGVTTELDMFTEPASAAQMRAEQARPGGVTDRSDLFSAGVLATAPGGHGTEYGFAIPTITEADSAEAWVDARIAEGSDYIKLVYDDGALFGLSWPTLSYGTMEAIIDAAHARGMMA
ncbi:MAG: amidohydrolase family protein, partial [Longimicrobiales bacterium]